MNSLAYINAFDKASFQLVILPTATLNANWPTSSNQMNNIHCHSFLADFWLSVQEKKELEISGFPK